MATQGFPPLDDVALAETRDALHGYARVLGGWLTACRPERKHWWQGSLRPSLQGVTTGVVYAGPNFELELNLRNSQLHARTAPGHELVESLHGQPANEIAERIQDFLLGSGLDKRFVPDAPKQKKGPDADARYSAESANAIAVAWSSITSAFEEFQAGIREETSAVQLWPHHFDLAVTWLPGDTVPGQDPSDAEHADKQMAFGFTLGDETIPEPYFYVSAYPRPEAFPTVALPVGTVWHVEGFQAAVLPYRVLTESQDPRGYLLELWGGLLSAGRGEMGR